MPIASWSRGMTVPPFNSALKPAIRSRGQSDRFRSVRFLTRPAPGQDLAALAVALAQEDGGR